MLDVGSNTSFSKLFESDMWANVFQESQIWMQFYKWTEKYSRYIWKYKLFIYNVLIEFYLYM